MKGLKRLTRDRLEEYCKDRGLLHSGDKNVLSKRLVDDGMKDIYVIEHAPFEHEDVVEMDGDEQKQEDSRLRRE